MRTTDAWSWFRYDKDLSLPKTTTQSTLEKGLENIAKARIVLRKQLNFQSYPMQDMRFNLLAIKRDEPDEITTTYQRDYTYSKIMRTKCKPKAMYDPPDWLLNRRPVNPFEMLPCSAYKFMDDKLINVTDARKKVDFFRQLRNSHYALV